MRRWLTAVAWAVGVVAAFALNLRLSQTTPANSDGASQGLQAWDLLHANVLLHGWITGDVAYFPNDVSVYALIDLVHGLNQDAVHWYGALMYTLAMLLAALLAMGRAGEAPGRVRLARGAVAAGIMIAPQFQAGVYALLQGPDHFGTAVPVLLAWLILDRARPRWYVPVIIALIIAITGIADLTALVTAAIPLLAVCAYRVLRARVLRRQSLGSQHYETSLAVAGLAAAVISNEGPRILAAIGSLTQVAPITQLAPLHVIFWHNFRVAGLCLLVLAGADFAGVHPPLRAGFEVLHLTGAALGACAILIAAWRFLRDNDVISQLLLAGIAANLLTFVVGTHAEEITFTREISDVLPFAAALAGRLLARRLLALRLVPVLAVVLCGYLAGLGYEVRQPVLPAQNQQLVSWLEDHGLHHGLSGYWAANAVTLASREHVRILALNRQGGKFIPATQLVKREWLDPKVSSASFVVFFPTIVGSKPFTGFTGMVGFPYEQTAIATFGRPARIYHYEQYTIYVWNKNLLADMGGPVVPAAG